jgi:hypothetical protein
MPIWAQAIGAILIALCMYVSCLTFRSNSFAAPVVKIASERGHRIADSGPYAHVRHPMYAGALLFFVGTPLLLGSWYGLAAVPVLTRAGGTRGDGGTDAGGRTAGLSRLRHARALPAQSRPVVARPTGRARVREGA